MNSDYYLYEEKKKIKEKIFINKIKSGQLNIGIINDKFLNILNNINKMREELLNIFKTKDINEFNNFIINNEIIIPYYINNSKFDLLIYAIENNISYEMIKCIISYYDTLNYTFYYKYIDDISPLFVSIINKKYLISQLLIESGADINYDMELIYHLKSYNLNFILNNGFNLTSETIEYLLNNKNNELLISIFNHFIYEKSFIIKPSQYF